MTLHKPEVLIHTDGACSPNPGPGGWACILRFDDKVKESSGYVPEPSTNNRCEMGAVIEALKLLKKTCKVRLRTDSMVCIHTINSFGGKAKTRKNPDLVTKIHEQMVRHEVTAEWIQGHAGNTDNERCDQLANEAFREKRNPTPEYSTPAEITLPGFDAN